MARGRYLALYNFCSTLKTVKKNSLPTLIPHLNDKALELLYEVISNTIGNKRRYTKKQKSNLKRKTRKFKRHLRFLARKRNSKHKKKIVIRQIGSGVLATLITVALPLLLHALRKK